MKRFIVGTIFAITSIVWISVTIWDVLDEGVGIIIIPTIIFFASLALMRWGWVNWKKT